MSRLRPSWHKRSRNHFLWMYEEGAVMESKMTRRHFLRFGGSALAVGASVLWLAGCNDSLAGSDNGVQNSAAQEPEALKVRTYASPLRSSETPLNHSCNTHWIETDEGVVVFDGQWVLSQAEKALEEIQKSNKPIIGIFVTHPHTDHFGGLGAFARAYPDAPIYASRTTLESISKDEQGFIEQRKKEFGDDFPAPDQVTLPDRIVRDGDEIRLGGLTFRVIDLPHNEAETTTLLYVPDHEVLFLGDLVSNEVTPIFLQGGTENWVDQLGLVLDSYSGLRTIYPGHGAPGAAVPMLEAEFEYLITFRSLVDRELSSEGKVSSEAQDTIVAEMERRYPEYVGAAGFSRRELLEGDVGWLAEDLSSGARGDAGDLS